MFKPDLAQAATEISLLLLKNYPGASTFLQTIYLVIS
jgi:hypothetical protein